MADKVQITVTQKTRTVVSGKWIFLTTNVLGAQPAPKGNDNDNRKQS